MYVVHAAITPMLTWQDFNLFLKSLKNPNGTSVWSVESINAIPIAGNAIAVVFVWIYGFLSDYLQTRWLIVMIQAVCAARSV